VLAFEDSMGRAGLIRAGEFQRITAGRGIRYGETNTSPSNWAHVFQVWLRPSVTGLGSDHEQQRFSAADRRGGLRIVASPDGRSGSLLVHQDACLYSALLQRGQHVVHEVKPGRGVWLHVVEGHISLGGLTLSQGDGVGITDEPSVSLTADDEAEVLLIDLCPIMPPPLVEGAAPDWSNGA
jgi:redox-sensitive bicupin YhaK (pirin superfamily)